MPLPQHLAPRVPRRLAPRRLAPPRLALLASLLAAAAGQSGPWPAQPAHWPHYPSRRVTVLTGTWAYGFAPAGALDPAAVAYADVRTPGAAAVPGSWDVHEPGTNGSQGTAFFRSTHACTPGAPALLSFDAVNFFARVWADGAELGNHTAGGYVPFSFIAPACGAGGSRELLVLANNEKNRTLSPTYTGGDFYFYSGIIRPVTVSELPCGADPFILRVEPLTVDAARGLLDLRVVLGAGLCPPNSPLPGSVHLGVGFNGADPGTPVEYAVADGVAVIPSIAVPPPFAPWTVREGASAPYSPNLVEVRVREGASQDVVAVRTGLRVVTADAASARILVNGARVKLRGWNRHTMWPDVGAAVRPDQEAADMALIVAANANYVRGAHYPQSQSWLDLCDENGIAMWEETLGPSTSTDDMNDPHFMSNHLVAVASMVEASFSHPSVILHAFFNEGPSYDVKACVGYAESAAAVRARVGVPPKALVTWANNHGSSDVCIAYEDVISFNGYPAWYDHPGNISYVKTSWDGTVSWAARTFPEKPVTVSETGGGGVFEWVNASAPFPGTYWGQNYQKVLVSEDATVLLNDTRVSGLSLWQFADIAVANGNCAQCAYLPHPDNYSVPWDCAYVDVSCGRPKRENNKGSVDFWRREKLAYPAVAQIFLDNAHN